MAWAARARLLPPPKPQIHAGADGVRFFLQLDEGAGEAGNLRGEADQRIAEIVVAIFDEGREIFAERDLAAAADRPAVARHAFAIGGAEDRRRRPIFVALPAGSALRIGKDAIEGIADAAGDAAEPADAL